MMRLRLCAPPSAEPTQRRRRIWRADQSTADFEMLEPDRDRCRQVGINRQRAAMEPEAIYICGDLMNSDAGSKGPQQPSAFRGEPKPRTVISAADVVTTADEQRHYYRWAEPYTVRHT